MGAFTIQIYQKFFDFKREKVYNVLILKRTEDSHSGLVHYLGKVATGKPVRGFESLILRQNSNLAIKAILNNTFLFS
jgi:hypothetical protein